ncbi:DEAD/DEAH box helicase [Candidatus Sumerlaeota bacterium]|nr:DEAD/DEAH box helicase [Candidatus Sumerlaeota bacterium]
MSLEEWQLALRREFGREQKFKLENLGEEPVFSEFRVTNPESGGAYRVAIRGEAPGVNYCSCPDYAVNTLGSCKHIEFTLEKLRRKRGGKKALAQGFQPPFSEIYLRYGLKREVVFGPAAECPAALRKLAAKYFGANELLKPEAYARFDVFLREASRIAQKADHELRCYEDTLGFIAQVRDQARRATAIDKVFPDGAESAAFKRLLKVSLYPYQRQGALFAARAGRCLLADDMGLGKTIQAIATAEILARTADIERALVICPTSLKHQWRSEIERFTGRSAQVVEGPIAAREAAYSSNSFFKIVNYDVIHRDAEAIRRWAPDLIVLDEAQRIKNWKTRAARAVKRLPSEHAIVLTGTPLENRLEELHSIVEFVDRHRLGPTFRFLAEHQHVDENGKVVGYRNLSQVAKTLSPILLRRTKREVLSELPERLDKTFFVPMTPEQMAHHEENQETVAKLVAKWRRHRMLTEPDQRRLMIALQNMRMACNSTWLLDHETDFGVKADEAATQLEEIFESNGAKAVVFSQWLRTHELLQRRFADRRWEHVLFHGGVPGPKRKELVRRFKEDPECRIFLSTDAGGVGLNLQHASVVVNMDQPWNPAVLEQRIGRVHRLGQRQPVRVINYVAQGTIEHGMLSLIDFKKSLFAGVLDGGSDEVFLGGTRLNRFMETVERASGGIPPAAPSEEPDASGAEEISDARMDQEKEREAITAAASSSSGADGANAAWNELAAAGMNFLEKLGQALQQPTNASSSTDDKKQSSPLGAVSDGLESFLTRDERAGQPYFKLPLPQPEVLQSLADLLGRLAVSKK